MNKTGAHRGLVEMGFNVSSLDRLHLALKCIIQHFEDHLSDDDRSVLGFDLGYGVIFVEHVLCKIVRWKWRLKQNCSNRILMSTLGAAARRGDSWKKGANFNKP